MNRRIAQRLQRYRRANAFSQEELAAKIGVSLQVVSKWESAEALPDTANLISLAQLYGITIDELINGNTEPAGQASVENNKNKSNITKENDIDTPADFVKQKSDGEHAGTEQSWVDDDISSNTGEENNDFGDEDKHAPMWFTAMLPILTAIAYLTMGFTLERGWSVGWIVFFLIPIVPSLITAIRKRKPSRFSYPVFVAGLYLISGLIFDRWNPEWIIFLTIPIFYILCGAYERRNRQRAKKSI